MVEVIICGRGAEKQDLLRLVISQFINQEQVDVLQPLRIDALPPLGGDMMAPTDGKKIAVVSNSTAVEMDLSEYIDQDVYATPEMRMIMTAPLAKPKEAWQNDYHDPRRNRR